MKKIPNIFKPTTNHNFNNNKKVYYSYLDNSFTNTFSNTKEKENNEVVDVLYRLTHDGSYIFNKKVIIKTKDKTYDTKIAGTINDKIITLDSNSIPIKDVISISLKP